MEQTVNIYGVTLDDLDDQWPLLLPHLSRALEYDGDNSATDVYDLVDNRDAQLWGIDIGYETVGVAVTFIQSTTKRDVLTIWLVGGRRMPDWVYALEDVTTRYAAAQGCDEVQMIGRRGWIKYLSRAGWGESSTIFTKRLANG